ncbi:MAG: hypothetical protein HWD59_08485 [Coxiellaceae bacterium]|nr:MAG: hypothetical protein HWD59_08485 [Coxiellaceae bacterium]
MMGYTKLFNTAKNAYARWQGYGRLVSVTALALLRGEVTIAGLQGKIRQKLQLQQQLKQSMQQDAARYLSTYHVIYIYSLAAGESARYRVHNNVEVLQAAGYNAQAFAEQEIRNLIKYQINAQTVVLARLSLAAAALDPVAMPDPAAINDFLQYAKHKSMQIVFDIDDLAFEPELLPQIQGFTAAQRKFIYK